MIENIQETTQEEAIDFHADIKAVVQKHLGENAQFILLCPEDVNGACISNVLPNEMIGYFLSAATAMYMGNMRSHIVEEDGEPRSGMN